MTALNAAESPESDDGQDDEVLLRLVASALFIVSSRAEAGHRLRYPYPVQLQRAIDRLATVFLTRGIDPPQSVADFFSLCQQPLHEWPLNLCAEAVGDGDTLLIDDRITSLCDEWAEKDVFDVEGEVSEQSLIDDVRRICRNTDSQNGYIGFRRMLIEQPVVTAFDLKKACLSSSLLPLSDQLNASYQPAPRCHAEDGQFKCCINCRSLLLKTSEGSFVCENDACRVNGDYVSGRLLPVEDEVLWLRRELRRFVMMPGLAELRLYDLLLDQDGIEVELWPAFDRYDLLVRFADREVWAIDVKDQRNPYLLAKRALPPPDDPAWDRAFFVFPDVRQRERSDYLRAFSNYTEVLSGRVEACFESQLLKQFKGRARSKAHA